MLKFIRFIKFIILTSSPFGYPNGNFFNKDTLRPDETADNLPYEKVGNNDPVCIANEVPFDIPDSWEWVRLSVVAQLLDGKKINGESHPYLEAKYLRGRATPTIKTSGKYVKKHTKVILVDGENSGEVFTLSESGYLGSTFKVLYSTSEVYTDYLLLFILLRKQFLRQNKVGAAIPHLNKNIFFSLLFPLPPYEEQIRIVEQYNTLTPFIDNYGVFENKLDILNVSFPELLKKSILQEAVQGKLVPQDPNDEPASVLLERIRAEKQALIKAGKIKKDKNESVIFRRDNSHYEKRGAEEVCIDDELPFEIPENWCWARMGSCLDVRDGTHDTPKYVLEGIPLVTSKNLCNGKIDFSTAKFISREDHLAISLRSKVDAGDIMYAMIGSIGNPVLYNGNAEFSIKNMALFKKIANGLDMEYVYWFLYLSQETMKKFASGGVQAFVSLGYLRNYWIPVPPIQEQHRIVTAIKQILPKISTL